MFSIYATAWSFAKANLAVLVVYGALLQALDMFVESTGSSATYTLAPWVIIFYALHRAFLFGETQLLRKEKSPKRPHAMGRFFLASGAMIVPAAAMLVAIAMGILDLGWFPSDPNVMVISIMGLILGAFVLTLLFFGTALPAAASADQWGPPTSLSRGIKTWKYVLGGLLVGQVLFTACLVLIIFGLASFGLQIGSGLTGTGGINFVDAALGLVFSTAIVFGNVLTVVVLCRAYERVAPPEIQALLEHREGKFDASVFA
ncbi:hypothetical protein [Yoonia sp. SS1-5]|uniref:Uncharacterized protein n=1 Tax=Yoonia rhodophyticola TaxID=3137370 RepID=A0AAN0MDI6_9RHOB